jgi:2-oxoisovalerate dehydrogenase E1 component alpha subunit
MDASRQEPGTQPARTVAGRTAEVDADEPRAAVSPDGSEALTADDLQALYRLMVLARSLDERMWILNRTGQVAFVISGQGHEGAQAGIAWAFRPGLDWLVPYYRSITSCLRFGMTAREMLLGSFAKAADPSSGGRQMPNHYGQFERKILSVSSPVGVQLLHAAGIAFAAMLRRTGEVVLTTMGEGASNQGDVHEGLNFAAIHRLPMVYVVENNGYAISVPSERELPTRDVASRAAAYGIPGVIVDGADVLACYRAAREAVRRARAGEGPSLIEAKVERLTAHSSDDQQTRYRTEAELASQRARDPLPRFREELRAAGLLGDEDEARLRADVVAIVDDATTFAAAQPDPTIESALRWVFAEAWPSERPPAWGVGDQAGHQPE